MVAYTVHDVVADTWSFPQVSPTEASAVRDFNQLKSRPNVPSADLECVLLGEWSPDKGDLFVHHRKVLVPADRKESDEVQHKV